ncbi:MAG: dTMP kinase [Gammaproteobacteria bacterium]|jgi:dTMP kinase|nr:dTMP kinase [Gammaproteobacteria bacterium]MBT4462058.1 dTMP kinase [Gammaproteobacteria bacterium]MBT4654675.1 dTMP kinase [Gammaproteobacteria bacterium]MBT5116741.1 dTMP kinase [Gammaproteobacteria bacterium]MBT5761238.1 dTMP kinase [Gammaproteobacteria bacterium]
MSHKKFIVFEGNEGTGKSTHIKFASDYLTQKKIEHIVTREPGGTKFGESVRSILLDKNSDLDSLSEAMLFYASRVFNYNNVILKALNAGKYVICDRFHYSTLVYQGMVENNEKVIQLHKTLDSYFSEHISLIIHLDASIKNCLSRINSRKTSDKFELQGEKFLIKIKSSYEKVFSDNEKSVKILTDEDINSVQSNIKKHLNMLINE